MRIRRRSTHAEFVSRTRQWHRVFTIRPVLIDDYWYFLCWVERQAVWSVGESILKGFYYRLPQRKA